MNTVSLFCITLSLFNLNLGDEITEKNIGVANFSSPKSETLTLNLQPVYEITPYPEQKCSVYAVAIEIGEISPEELDIKFEIISLEKYSVMTARPKFGRPSSDPGLQVLKIAGTTVLLAQVRIPKKIITEYQKVGEVAVKATIKKKS